MACSNPSELLACSNKWNPPPDPGPYIEPINYIYNIEQESTVYPP